MISQLKMGMFSLAFGALLAAAGCQSSGMSAPASHEMAADAVRCDKCQTTWVKSPQSNGRTPGSIAYTDTQKMECPDCKDKVVNFFTTGKLMEHQCTACGGNMVACKGH